MKASEIRDMTAAEAADKVKAISEELFRLKWQKGLQGTIENPARVRTLKKDRARLLTIIQEKTR